MKNRKVWNIVTILLPLAAALLSALPNVVRMDWFGGFTTYCSAYSLVPVGYAVWGPMVAAISSIGLIVLGIVNVSRSSSKLRNWMIGIAATAVILELVTAILSNMTAVGGIITALLAVDAVLLCITKYRK